MPTFNSRIRYTHHTLLTFLSAFNVTVPNWTRNHPRQAPSVASSLPDYLVLSVKIPLISMTTPPKPRSLASSRGQPQCEMVEIGGVVTNDKSVDESHFPTHTHNLPLHHGKKITKGVQAQGESGRRGIHPIQFMRICFRSSCTLSKFVNILWPFVPAAFALVRIHHLSSPRLHLYS
jgi:hypothetical protein